MNRKIAASVEVEVPIPPPVLLRRVMPGDHRYGDVYGYTKRQMCEYAKRCVAAERSRNSTDPDTEDELGHKALEVLRAVAMIAAGGKGITINSYWGYGTATVTDSDGAHTHVGADCWDTDAECLAAFVSGLHDLLVAGRGLSWVAERHR